MVLCALLNLPRLTATNLKDGGRKRIAVHRLWRQHAPWSLSKQSFEILHGIPRCHRSRRRGESETNPSSAVGWARNVAVVTLSCSCTCVRISTSHVTMLILQLSPIPRCDAGQLKPSLIPHFGESICTRQIRGLVIAQDAPDAPPPQRPVTRRVSVMGLNSAASLSAPAL
jgi:hypothetical protein